MRIGPIRNKLGLSVLRMVGHQHYILHGRDRFIRSFHTSDASPSIPFEVPFFGMRYRGNLNDSLDWSVFMYGAYSPHELYILRDVAATLSKENVVPVTFFDIGANVGQHSLFMSKHVSQVFSFEPFVYARNKLVDKVEQNKRENMVVYPIGLGEVDAELDFFEPSGSNHGTGSFLSNASDNSCVAKKLPVRRGDDFLDSNSLPRMDIVKMDVEGYEARVLSGLRKRLRNDRPVILMEISGPTRAEMLSESAFRSLLYEDACIFELGSVSISSSYRIRPFHFESSEEILIVPNEKTSLLRFIRSRG